MCVCVSMPRPTRRPSAGRSVASLDHLSVCRTRLLLSPETQQQTSDPGPRVWMCVCVYVCVHRRQCQYHNSIAAAPLSRHPSARSICFEVQTPVSFRILAVTITIRGSSSAAAGLLVVVTEVAVVTVSCASSYSKTRWVAERGTQVFKSRTLDSEFILPFSHLTLEVFVKVSRTIPEVGAAVTNCATGVRDCLPFWKHLGLSTYFLFHPSFIVTVHSFLITL